METQQEATQEVVLQPIENIVKFDDGQMFTTSLIIAQAFEKEHKNVLRDIENLECSPEFHRLNFELCNYSSELAPDGRKYPAYRLTRDGFAFLAMGFTGKKAAAWKEKFLAAFNAMERRLLARQCEFEGYAKDELPDQDEREEAPSSLDCFVSQRRKLNKQQIEAIRGLANLVAHIEKNSIEKVLRQLLVVMQVRQLEDIQRHRFYEAAEFLWRKTTFISGTDCGMTEDAPDESPEALTALTGFLNFWAYVGVGYSKSAVRNYICNLCNIAGFEEIGTEVAAQKALLAAIKGFMKRTLLRLDGLRSLE